MMITPEELMGRLNGQRRLFVNILTMLATDPRHAEALSALEQETAITRDHQEDPGAVPSSAFSIQSHADEEIRTIIADALARAKAS